MAKEDYREKVEEHRQEIDLHNESEAKMSRVSRHHKKGAKKQRNPMMTILVVIFIFIPLSILGYVLFIFDPGSKQNDVVKEAEDDQLVEIQKHDPNEVKVVESTKKDDEAEAKKNDAEDDQDEAEKERLAAEEAKKVEEQKQAKAKATEEKKVKEVEAAQKAAAQKAREQEEKKKADAQKAEAKTEQKTHTVQSTDNLYRIALKYYGDGSPASIEKIKAANNLTSDSISTGQVLIINP